MTRKKQTKRALYLNSLAGDKMKVRLRQLVEHAAQGKTFAEMSRLLELDEHYLRHLAQTNGIEVARSTTKVYSNEYMKVARRAKQSPTEPNIIVPPFYMADPFLTLRQRDHAVYLTSEGYRLNGAPATPAAIVAAANRIRMQQCKPLYELPEDQEAA